MAKWERIGSRGNVEDRRALGPVMAGGIGLTGIFLLMIFNLLAGGDPGDVLSQLDSIPIQTQQIDESAFEGKDSYEVFVSTVLGSNNDMWTDLFKKLNRSYLPPKLVLFRTATSSGCGRATSQVGPHYCPLDETIYLDETFFDELKTVLARVEEMWQRHM